MQLNFREYGGPDDGQPLVFLHGLFGSSSNWRGIVKRFEDRHGILVPDLRNHGRSPHHDEVSYRAQAADLVELLDAAGVTRAVFIGHSMGGKVAMHLALYHADRVAALVCVDMAPAAYPQDRFGPVFEALAAVQPQTLESRQQADERLATLLPARNLRSYLLQNLIKDEHGWRWRLNLPALQKGMGQISAFESLGHRDFPGPALFIYGGNSPYVRPEHLPVIRQLFPYARVRQIVGAGHWVFYDQPQAFGEALAGFLETNAL